MKRRRSLRYFLLISLVCTVLFLVVKKLLLHGNEATPSRNKASTEVESPATAELEGMEYSEVEKGRTLWTLYADKALFFQEEKRSLLHAVKVKFYLEDGSNVELKADRAVMYAGTKNLELSGRVHVRLPYGYTLITDRAAYSNASGEVYSNRPLRVYGPLLEGTVNSWRFDVKNMIGYGEGGVDFFINVSGVPR